jgi:hypothetical protein
METTLEEEAPYLDVITEADILTVSDGRGFVVAHAGSTHNVIACELKTFATVLQVARQMRKIFCLIFHVFVFEFQGKDSDFLLKSLSE